MASRTRSVTSTVLPETCFIRYTLMPPRIKRQMLSAPASRRLLVLSAAYYIDREHLHFFSRPRGDAFTRVFLILDGSGTITVRDRPHHLTSGSILVTPPGVPHSGQPGRGGWVLWYCDLDGTDVVDIFESAGIDADRPHLRPVDVQGLAALIQTMVDAYEIDYSPTRVLEAVGAGWMLMTRLVMDGPTADRRGSLDRAVDFIRHHVADEVRVPALATAVGLSAARLQRIFRESLGTGVRSYQTGLRMQRARELLAETHQPIARVAREVGYSDAAYFSRHFRAFNGVSPSAYRRAAGGAERDHSARSIRTQS